ncbi:MAG TPA: class I SAM-dependent methyltransferase [bacterium]|jgi:2-polyprenyl-3-methyl-5-hydroxy-6-metoxy-1,4-benzoquinol methylase|nr:class I SAM-dependent methyltransferase [bacterium]HNT65779.1 class I SAM-dependent methyltransferase [bacterium]HOX85468.1 class I SAM-dependent methyltransferase [bacterium]HPG44627.1 class I SAM-dependent methyltransferase [bacterium]HPM97185.1 class I SAM-dependent methyltransferase [bacterium]
METGGKAESTARRPFDQGSAGLFIVLKLAKKEQESAPYSILAQIYDFVMDHVDYAAWAAYIARLLSHHQVTAQSLVDISCGTGSFCLSTALNKLQVYGCDGSSEMVRQAICKAAKKRRRSLFWCADMAAFASRRRFDCVVSLYDSMNYLLEESQWRQCLLRVEEALEPGGVFIFDVSTLRNSRDFFNRFVQKEQNQQVVYRRKSYFEERQKIQHNEFAITFRNNPQQIYHEHHRQRIRSLAEIEELIEETPFAILGQYNGFSLQAGSDQSERVHFVLQKPQERTVKTSTSRA